MRGHLPATILDATREKVMNINRSKKGFYGGLNCVGCDEIK